MNGVDRLHILGEVGIQTWVFSLSIECFPLTCADNGLINIVLEPQVLCVFQKNAQAQAGRSGGVETEAKVSQVAEHQTAGFHSPSCLMPAGCGDPRCRLWGPSPPAVGAVGKFRVDGTRRGFIV